MKSCTSSLASGTQPDETDERLCVKIKEIDWSGELKNSKRSRKGRKARSSFKPVITGLPPSLDELMSALYESCKDACIFQYLRPKETPLCSPEDDINVETVVEVSFICTCKHWCHSMSVN